MTQPPFAYYEPAILQGESGGDWNALYGYQNRSGGLFGDVKVSDMTINEVLDFQRTGSPYATYVTDILCYKSTPVGGYQIVGDTLQGAKRGMGLTGEEKFDPAMQRQVAQYIFDTQGPSAWEALKGTQMADQMTPPQMAPQQAAGYQPFSPESLSRSQRTMLGFAALRDAAAALRGNQTNFFSEALGGLEAQHRYGQELAFRQGQEQRILGQERQTRELTMLQQRRLIQTERDKAYNLGMPTTGYDAQLAAVDGALSQMGSVFGQPAAAPQPAAVGVEPAAGGVEPAADGVEPAAQALNVRTASERVYNPNTTDAQLNEAIEFLSQRAATDLNVQGILKAAIDERNRRATMAGAAENYEAVRQNFEAQGRKVASFLIEGYDQDGNPIFRPTLVTKAGRMVEGLIESADYKNYVGALDNIKNILTFEKMAELRKADVTFGALSDNELKTIAATASTLNLDDPIGTFNALLNLERQYDIDLGLGSRKAGGAGGTIGGLVFTEDRP
jgi:hypothetical protein